MGIYDSVNRRSKILDALTAQAIMPRKTQMVSGRAVPFSIGEGLTQLAQAYMANQGQQNIDEERKAIEAEEAQGVKDAMQGVMKQYSGAKETRYQLSPEETMGQGDIQSIVSTPAVKADPTGAAMRAATDPYLSRSKPAQAMMLQLMKNKGGSSTSRPYFTPEDTVTIEKGDNGIDRYVVRKRVLNRRTGEYIDGGKEYVSPKDPRVQALTAGSKRQAVSDVDLDMKPKITDADTRAKKGAERAHGMEGLNEIIDRAEAQMDKGVATESGIGALVDAGMRLVGISAESSRSAAALEAIGAALTGKMPRFEGPQSDYDREYYQEMAAKVGKRTIPIAERREALKEVRRLWAQYDTRKKTGDPQRVSIDTPPPPPGFKVD